MINKNNIYFKATHYLIAKNIFVFKCKTKSATAELEKQGFLFRLFKNTK